MKSAKIFIAFTFLLAFAVCVSAQDVKVSKVNAETVDSIFFEMSVSQSKIKRGEDIRVKYAVTNKSNRNIYLIAEPFPPQVMINELWILRILSPVIYPDAHFQYKYDLIKILPKKTYKKSLVIKAQTYLSDTKYGFEDAAIQAEFSYLFDISNLNGCKEAEYSLPCLNEVYKNSRNLTIGNLVIDIEK